MKIDLHQFSRAFFEECAEHVSALEIGLLELEAHGAEPERLNRIFRAAHSIKGGAGTLGFESIAAFTHEFETLLDELRAGKRPCTTELVSALLRAGDALESLVAAVSLGTASPPAVESSLAELKALVGRVPETSTAATTPAAKSTRTAKITFVPGRTIFLQGSDPTLVLRELRGLASRYELQVDVSQVPPLASLNPEACFLSWKIELDTEASEADVRDVFSFVELDSTLSFQFLEHEQAAKRDAPPPPTTVTTETATFRVATEKIDRLIDLVGEMVIAQSMLLEQVSTHGQRSLTEAVLEMERNTRQLQERVLAIRMVPVGSIFSRFRRLVRDLAPRLGKQIELELEGEETELDRSMVEAISDPLTHLVRNAIDHGIEQAEARAASGKPVQGRVKLRAFHQSGNVIIEITDDGKGLDPIKLASKGRELGLIGPEPITDEDAQRLIFHAGFSTAKEITDLSGRGVGMDVVKRSIDSLNGTITLHSTAGSGTTVRISLPLTLAILDGMALRIGGQTYLVPLASIVESVRPRAAQVHSMPGGGEVIIVREQSLPLVRLARVLNVAGAEEDPTRGLVVVVDAGARFGLLVDELLGQSQVVLKNLERNYRRVDGVMGATILGDGRIALIVDLPAIQKRARSIPPFALPNPTHAVHEATR